MGHPRISIVRLLVSMLVLFRGCGGFAVRSIARLSRPRRDHRPLRQLAATADGGDPVGDASVSASAAAAAAAAGVTPTRLASLVARSVPEKDKKLVAFRQKYACAACACLLPPSYQVDHIEPLALGGSNGLANLQALCRPCHTQKTRDQRHLILQATAAARAQEEARAASEESARDRDDEAAATPAQTPTPSRAKRSAKPPAVEADESAAATTAEDKEGATLPTRRTAKRRAKPPTVEAEEADATDELAESEGTRTGTAAAKRAPSITRNKAAATAPTPKLETTIAQRRLVGMRVRDVASDGADVCGVIIEVRKNGWVSVRIADGAVVKRRRSALVCFDDDEDDGDDDDGAARTRRRRVAQPAAIPDATSAFAGIANDELTARFARLNAQQRAAVCAGLAPPLDGGGVGAAGGRAVRVIAGPGTGKTAVLTARVAELVARRGVAPRELLVVTFTNRAAREVSRDDVSHQDRLPQHRGVTVII